MSKRITTTLKIVVPLLVAAVVLWLTYRDYDFSELGAALGEMKVGWLLSALLFSFLAPVFRGLRWAQLLAAAGYRVSQSDSILTVFSGYAANIIIPRVGEVSRCAIMDRYAKVPFSKGLGTLVAERFIDMVFLLVIVGVTLLTQLQRLLLLFDKTGVAEEPAAAGDGFPLWKILLLVAALALLVAVVRYISKRMDISGKVKGFFINLWQGFAAVRRVRNLPLLLFYSIMIWVCYYLELYLAFYCFEETATVGPVAGLVCFAGSSMAVLVPTPNGAGPWHWAVTRLLGGYGVGAVYAGAFALVLHTAQTATYLLGGALGWVVLQLLHASGKVSPRGGE